MELKNKKIGIWGFGKTGQSALEHIAPLTKTITVFENNQLSEEQTFLLNHHKARLVPTTCLEQFLELNDVIIPSPGVNLKPYQEFWGHKFISELDIFAANIQKKTVAITGSVGKTTIVTLVTELLNRCGIRACAAGNIGLPMLSVLREQHEFDVIVLELSSFQLEQSKTFAPTVAVITNLFPNHLDRHETMEEYIRAKALIFAYQALDTQCSPSGSVNTQHEQQQQSVHTTCVQNNLTIIPQAFLEAFIPCTRNQKLLWLANDAYSENITPELEKNTFAANWNLIFAILEYFGIEPETVKTYCNDLKALEHRFEFVGTHAGIDFYNDSKATILESTLESIKKCSEKPVILFLGGLSKGVDRTELIRELPKNIKLVLCFGKEADTLQGLCRTFNVASMSFTTLELAFKECMNQASAGDIVLFSPAGASYDLFKNYEERGQVFKKLVKTISG